MAVPRRILGLDSYLLAFNHSIVWYSGIPILVGLLLAFADLFILLPYKRGNGGVLCLPVHDRRVTVALTAYNDEDSIGQAVRDFKNHALVDRVIVVSNNSSDATLQRAAEAGALTFNEEKAGYGHCCCGCYTEALRLAATDLIVLCEGDMTFRAGDLDKLVAYAAHAHIVNGTRIVEQLRQRNTQLGTFMYYGNFFVGKLIEMKHIGKGTFTDAGTTYKLIHKDALKRLLPKLDPSVNLEFNAHFLDVALASGEVVVECPITFHPRVGKSKGGNVSDLRALRVGMRMIFGLLFGWRLLGEGDQE